MSDGEMAEWIDRAMPWLIRMRDEYVDLIRHSEPEGCEPYAAAIVDLDSLIACERQPGLFEPDGQGATGCTE